MHPNLNELGIILRLFAALVLAIVSWLSGVFIIYTVAMLVVVFALSGWCPIQYFIDKKFKTQE